MELFGISARWPGSVNDARVLRTSSLYVFAGGFRPFPGAILLGDSIYPCNEWLIPPLPVVYTNAEVRFNRAQKITRSVVERAFGIMKNRFRVLQKIRVKTPEYSAEIIKWVCILHNLCLRLELERYAQDVQLPEGNGMENENLHEIPHIINDNRRRELADFFNQ